jgi:transcriptional regulator with XRE-family HTH domain
MMRGIRIVFDPRPALADMATQIRACRAADGLTLKQLAARCGVAASTIHKVEAQQMVPTVGVLLKIARGLGRSPQDLIRDEFPDSQALDGPKALESTEGSRMGRRDGADQVSAG